MLGARVFMVCVCVTPLRLEGLRGKKSTPSIGWGVPAKSLQLAVGRSEGTLVVGKHLQGPSSSVTVFLF